MLALADLSPATMYVASVETEGLNFVRRHVLADGKYNGGDIENKSLLTGHETQADNRLQLHGLYEVDIIKLVAGTAEIFEHTYLEMLNEMHYSS